MLCRVHLCLSLLSLVFILREGGSKNPIFPFKREWAGVVVFQFFRQTYHSTIVPYLYVYSVNEWAGFWWYPVGSLLL